MKYMLKYGTMLLVLALIASGCREEPNYSEIPHIEFDRVEQYTYTNNKIISDTLIIAIDFQDGDGNLGLNRVGLDGTQSGPDFEPPFNSGSLYFNNFFAKLQIKRGNTYVDSFVNFDGRFPRLSSSDSPETLEGEIRYTIDSFSSDAFPPGDTVRFEIFIYDRDLNKSNVVYTDDVVIYQGQGR
ncbi:hypothetical protein [Pontibacter oryzae]|uniref:DUF4625 domain-containing protein n=1 Tax=Pontibacter oryzae TaxID=2304593 RepID=A0A399SHT6_9BACT|nr:hypothetical protein [Pontibacter oryzae]RIJ41417.1 hypothetical protein D1627_05080 [Pontibacter oryzae]